MSTERATTMSYFPGCSPERSLMIACPGCLLRLREVHLHLKHNESDRNIYEKKWGRPFDPQLNIIHFFELLDQMDLVALLRHQLPAFAQLKFVPYYGCMLAHPPSLRHKQNYHGLMEKTLAALGAVPLSWAYGSRCCGTFLSVSRPDIVTPIVNRIISNARDAGAECIITACAMCHLNLETRCNFKQAVPILHFSEVLALILGIGDHQYWFARHLVDPVPLLKSKGLIS